MVDDNFIGNKRVSAPRTPPWMAAHPFRLSTEASVDLAQDQELLDLMVAANFAP